MADFILTAQSNGTVTATYPGYSATEVSYNAPTQTQAVAGAQEMLNAANVARRLVNSQVQTGAVLNNFKTTNLEKWRQARARVVAGTGRGRILCIGDSTTAGVGATDSTGRLRQSWPYWMAQMLAAGGVPAINKSIVGYQGVSSGNYTTFNSETSIGAGWGANTNSTVGGQPWFNNSTTNSIDWTVPGSTDSAVFYHVGALTGTYSWAINAGGATNIVVSPTVAGYTKATPVTFTKASGNVIKIARVSGDTRVCCAIAWDSTVPAVDVVNLGRGSSVSGDWVSSTPAYGPLSAIPVHGADADLTVIDLGINDYTPANSVSQATFAANLQQLVSLCKTYTDVVLVVPVPSDVSRQTFALQVSYTNIIRQIAMDNDIPYVDFPVAWRSYTAANALSFYTDVVHPTAIGYADKGTTMARALASI